MNVKYMKNNKKSQRNGEWDAIYVRRGIQKIVKGAVIGHDKSCTENVNIIIIYSTNQLYI